MHDTSNIYMHVDVEKRGLVYTTTDSPASLWEEAVGRRRKLAFFAGFLTLKYYACGGSGPGQDHNKQPSHAYGGRAAAPDYLIDWKKRHTYLRRIIIERTMCFFGKTLLNLSRLN